LEERRVGPKGGDRKPGVGRGKKKEKCVSTKNRKKGG